MKNIVLIGMSGVGKTTIGKHISKELDFDFLDTDELIVNEANMTVESIFSTYGEAYFRELESRIIEGLSSKNKQIISTGGGIVLNNKNIVNLRKKGIIFLLDSSIENIVNNIRKSTTVRPLLSGEIDIYNSVKSLLNKRKELYLSAADYIVTVDDKSIDKIVYEILDIYAKINY